MKPVQWVILLGVVAAMVFGVTYAVNFMAVRGGKSAGPAAAPQERLTFADLVTNFPQSGPPAECELGKSQAHDFWFKNESAQDMPVGVISKTCQCTSVQLWVGPKDWKDVPKVAYRDLSVKDVESAASAVELKEKESGAVVPAGAVGFIRLAWRGDRAGQKSLAADLWMGDKATGPTQRFEIRTMFVSPLHSVPEVAAGELTRDDLPQTVLVPCWSTTRSDFPLDARPFQSRWKEESSPFAVGKPEKMGEPDLARLRRDPANGAVLAAYNVPVTLNKASPDGMTAFDLGPFRLRIELKTDGGEPAVVVVSGSVRGDLAPVDAAAVPVRLGPFVRTQEASRQIILESEAAVTRLELDRARTPDFLDVGFPSGSGANGGRKTWALQVTWVPGSQAGGIFPRDEDGYRDSAVYIRPVYAKTSGAPPPCLRIPVTGTADTPP